MSYNITEQANMARSIYYTIVSAFVRSQGETT